MSALRAYLYARTQAALLSPRSAPQALKLYVDGTNLLYVDGTDLRRIARHLGVNPQTVANWVDAASANLSAPLSVSVEGDNAELRHYLARLGRKSRCFSRYLWALTRAVALFVYAWNRRQRAKCAFPKMPFHVCDFVADLI